MGATSSSTHHPGRTTEPARLHGLDRLKGCAIVTVLWIHGFQAWDVSKSVPMQWSVVLCAWSVPAFFFASGWLHARATPYPPGTVARWFRRIGIPYVIATFYVTLFDTYVMGFPTSLAGVPFDLLLGRGIYYFVPVLLAMLLITMPLARSRRAAWIVWALLAPYMFVGLRYDPVLWLFGGSWAVMMRSPFHWGPFFVTGWVCGITSPVWIDRLRPVVARTAPVLWIVLAGVLCMKFATWPAAYWPDWSKAARGTMILAAIATFISVSDRPASPVMRWLSDATLPLYLYHISFVSLFERILRPQTEIQYVQRMVLASVVTVLVVIGLRRILGQQRARALIG